MASLLEEALISLAVTLQRSTAALLVSCNVSSENSALIMSTLNDPLALRIMFLVVFMVGSRLLYSVVMRLGYVRTWLGILALFELIPLFTILVLEQPLDGFAVNLADKPSERRLWCCFTLMLTLSRALALFAPNSRAVRVHLAAVHFAELALFFCEQRDHAAKACPQSFPPLLFEEGATVEALNILFAQHVLHPMNCAGGGMSIIYKIVAANALLFWCYACAPIGPPAKPKARLKRD